MAIYHKWDQQPFDNEAIVVVPVASSASSAPTLLVTGTVTKQVIVTQEDVLGFLHAHAGHTFVTDDCAFLFWSLSQVAKDLMQVQATTGRLHDVVLFDKLLTGMKRGTTREALHFEVFWQGQAKGNLHSRDDFLRRLYLAYAGDDDTSRGEHRAEAAQELMAFVAWLAGIHQNQQEEERLLIDPIRAQLPAGWASVSGLQWRVQDAVARLAPNPHSIEFTADFRQELPDLWEQRWRACSRTIYSDNTARRAFKFVKGPVLGRNNQGRIQWRTRALQRWLHELNSNSQLYGGHPLPPLQWNDQDSNVASTTWKRLEFMDEALAAWIEADALVLIESVLHSTESVETTLTPAIAKKLIRDQRLSPSDAMWSWNWLRRHYHGPILTATTGFCFLVFRLPNLELLTLANRLRRECGEASTFYRSLCDGIDPVSSIATTLQSTCPEIVRSPRGPQEQIERSVRLASTLLRSVVTGMGVLSLKRLLEREYNLILSIEQVEALQRDAVFGPFPDLAKHWQDDSLNQMAKALGFSSQVDFGHRFMQIFYEKTTDFGSSCDLSGHLQLEATGVAMARFNRMIKEDFFQCMQQRNQAYIVRLFDGHAGDQETAALQMRLHEQWKTAHGTDSVLPEIDRALYHRLTSRAGGSHSGRNQLDMTFWESRVLPQAWTVEDAYAAVLFEVNACGLPVVASTKQEIVVMAYQDARMATVAEKLRSQVQTTLQQFLPDLPVQVTYGHQRDW